VGHDNATGAATRVKLSWGTSSTRQRPARITSRTAGRRLHGARSLRAPTRAFLVTRGTGLPFRRCYGPGLV